MADATCFVSYCHEDIDRDLLDYIVYLLEQNSEGKYEIALDDNIPYGSDLKEFMSLTEKVDAIIILLSPEYKTRVISRTGGVYEEFKRIVTRYEQLQDLKKEGKKISELPGYFELIPILVSGTRSQAVPDKISSIKYLDLVGLTVLRDKVGNFITTNHIRQRFVPQIISIADRLKFLTTTKNPSFETLYDEYYLRLFLELKSDWRNYRDRHNDYIQNLFVKTFAYRKIEQQTIYFIVGRKGSGKSTIADVLSIRQQHRYAGYVSIIADEFNLELAYHLFDWDQIRSDTRTFVSKMTCFQFVWEAFIYLWVIDILVELDAKNELNDAQNHLMSPLNQFIKLLIDQYELKPQEKHKVYFTYICYMIIDFINDSINNSRSDERFFYSDIQARFTRVRFLRFVFGEDLVSNFENLIGSFRKSFLITLDGFDTSFDMFRRTSIIHESHDSLERRASFEIDWLRSLLLLVLNIKQMNNGENNLYRLLEFCITVPQDRFHEIFSIERDSYRYHNRYSSLDWSGIELCILIRKRLEELSQNSTNKKKSASERLSEILKTSFSHIPSEISFIYNGRTYTMPLFFYVLRHTFWRPRDVLLYYASIIATAEGLRRNGLSTTTETLRRCIKDTTYAVIKSEFLTEFSSTILNINEIINAFNGQDQFLSYGEIGEILSKIDFKFASGDIDAKHTDNKIRFLYQIGFLGIEITTELRDRLNIEHRHAFYFNEGCGPIRTTGEKKFIDYTFIIHPVFTEYLGINTSKHDFVLELTWEYLYEMETILGTRGFDCL